MWPLLIRFFRYPDFRFVPECVGQSFKDDRLSIDTCSQEGSVGNGGTG
jgi:hypothetical protein